MRQWRTHRWGSFNEISGRYTDEISEDFYVPTVFRTQDTKNAQGSTQRDTGDNALGFSDSIDSDWNVRAEYIDQLETQRQSYELLLKSGTAKELARGILGTAFYTKFVWTVNARSLMNFLILRCEGHAQWEIREYAKVILSIFKEKMPWTADSMVKLFPSSFDYTDKI
jgi:thymidylate synthase (FAD)